MNTEVIKPREIAVSIETLKDDMKQLTDDFKEVMYFLGEKSKERIKEGGERIGSTLKSWGETAKSSASDAYEHISSQGKEVVEKSRRRIALNPITYFLAALTAGLVVGSILKKNE